MMQALIIHETLVSQFKFWWDGQIRKGMMFRNDLFCYVSHFSRDNRHQAFDLAGELLANNRQAIVTTETSHYTVWVSLKALEEEKNQTADPAATLSLGDTLQEQTYPSVEVA